MHVKSATVTALLGEVGLDDEWIRDRIKSRSFAPMTSTASRSRLRWSFGDAVRLEVYLRLLGAGLYPRVGAAIGQLPLGEGMLFALVVNDDDSYRGRAIGADAVQDFIESNPSGKSVVVVSIDDAAAVVGIVDQAARPDREDAA